MKAYSRFVVMCGLMLPHQQGAAYQLRTRIVVILMSICLCAQTYAAVIKSVQSGTAVSSGDGMVTVNLGAPVVPAQSILFFQTRTNGGQPTDMPPSRPGNSLIGGSLTGADTVEFSRFTTEASDNGIAETMNITWHVVEFESGVNVQHGQSRPDAGAQILFDVAINPVASLSQAFVLHSFSTTNESQGNNFSTNDLFVAQLTSTSNLQIRSENSSEFFQYWQVVEFTDAADINAQAGVTEIPDGTLSVDVTLGAAVDLETTFVLVGFAATQPDPGTNVGEILLRAELVDSTTLRITRNVGPGGSFTVLNDIVYQVVELRDGSRVLHGTGNIGLGASQVNVPLGDSVDVGRSVPLLSTQMGSGQNCGSSDYVADDAPGVALFTMSLSSDSINLQRNLDSAAADFAWQVVEFTTGAPVEHILINDDFTNEAGDMINELDGCANIGGTGSWANMNDGSCGTCSWTSNGISNNRYDGNTNLEMDFQGWFFQYIDTRGCGFSIARGTSYAFVTVLSRSAGGNLAMGFAQDGSWGFNSPGDNVRLIYVRDEGDLAINPGAPSPELDQLIDTGADSVLDTPQSVGMLIAEDGTVSAYYNNGIARNWAFNVPGTGWVDITPSGVPPMPEGGNNLGIQAVDTGGGSQLFMVDFVALVENPDTGQGPPVNLVSDWTLY